MKRCCSVLMLAVILQQAFAHSAATGDFGQGIDVFTLMKTFETMVSIFNSNNDTTLECLTAYRTTFNPDARTADYVWMVPIPGIPTPLALNIHTQVEDGGKLLRTLDDGSTIVSEFLYTDYTNCAVEEVDFGGPLCILWSDTAVKDSVPQHCIDEFAALCGVNVPEHTRDLCVDGEGEF
ncbi:uncharacterized protein LOC144152232 isoform X1 [Haemaphysalis longicornis]